MLLPQREALLIASGRAPHLYETLARLAANLHPASPMPLRTSLVAYAAGEPVFAADAARAPRLDFIYSWAHALLRASDDVYDDTVGAVLTAVRAKLAPSDRAWVELLLWLPRLPPLAMELLRADCEVDATTGEASPRLAVGLAALRELVLCRDGIRDEALELLLELCESAAEAPRSAAIRLVATSLSPADPSVLAVVEPVATSRLQAVLSSDDESEIPGGALLLLALVPLRLELLKLVLSAEARAATSAAARAVIGESLRDLLPRIDATKLSEVLIEAMDDVGAAAAAATAPGQDLLHLSLSVVCESAKAGTLPAQLSAGLLRLAGIEPPSSDGLLGVVYLVPLLPHLSASQARAVLPHVLRLPQAESREALARLMHAEPPPLRPEELLVELHVLAYEEHGVALKAVMEAVSLCLNERSVFSEVCVSTGLMSLVEVEPIPKLTMRTIMQAVSSLPALRPFVMDVLRRLLQRGVAQAPKLWEGFIKCCQRTMPESLDVLIELPAAQLEDVVEKLPDAQQQLATHAATNLDKVSEAALKVLGLADD